MDRQCSSCGGICKQSGCERENVATNDTSQERVDETEKDRHEPAAWVSLTKKEVLAISKINMDIIDMIYFVEAKVREKNHG